MFDLYNILLQNTQLTADLTRLRSGYSLVVALECETTICTETTNVTSTTEPTTTEDNNSSSKTISYTETTDETNEDEEITTTTEAPINTITTCDAKGKLFMNENVTLTFNANATHIAITAEKNEKLDFRVFCNEAFATWANTVTEVVIYGLDKKENNYDTKKLISSTTPLIDLCQLVDNGEIFFKFVDVN